MPSPKTTSDARPRLGVVLGRAATQPVSLGVAAAASVLAVGISSWALGVLGALAYVTLVAYDTFNPSFWQKVYAPAAAPAVKLPRSEDIRDRGTRDAVAAIAEAKAELARVIDETPPEVMANLGSTIASLGELDGHVARLVARAEDIAAHLAVVDVKELQADAASLGRRAASTTDAEAKAGFLDAKAARDDELRTLAELRQSKDRVDASLLRLVAVLAGVPTKIVHMRALDAQALDQMTGGLNAEIESVASEIKTSEDIMKSLGEVVR